MPASEASARLTDVYRERLVRLRDTILEATRRRWQLNPADLDASFERWQSRAGELVAFGQTQAVLLSNAYLGAFMSSELGEAVRQPGLDPESYAGKTRDGREISVVLALALVSVKQALLAKRSVSEALNEGRARAERAVRTEVVDAGRTALADAMTAEQRVVGYRRVTGGGRSCGACLALAGSFSHSDALMPIHASCRCTAEPIVEGVKERVKRPDGQALFDSMTPAQQDRLFAGRGGADKAELLRSGRASLSDLVSTAEGPDWGSTIFETPLQALAS